MTRPLVFALLLVVSVLSAAPAAGVDEIQSKVFVVTPWFLGGNEATFPKTPGGLIDLRDYLKVHDIELPPNGEAAYDPKAHTVTVSAPEDLIERSAELWIESKPVAVRFVFTLAEFSAADSLDLPDLGYEQLRKLAGDSWRVRDRVTLICESGRAATSNLTGKNAPAGKTATPAKQKEVTGEGPMPPDQFGTSVEAEPYIGPDGITIDGSFVYNHRIRPTPDQPSMLLRIQGNTTLTHNVPLVVQTATLAPPKGDHRAPAKELAVIVQASAIDRHGRSITMEPVEGGATPPAPKR